MTPEQATYDSRMKAFLAVSTVLGFFTVVLALLFSGREIEGSVKDVVLVMIGTLISSYREITGFFYGSSSGSAAKGATIERALQAATPLAGAEPVAVKVDTSAEPVAVAVESPLTPGDAHVSPKP